MATSVAPRPEPRRAPGGHRSRPELRVVGRPGSRRWGRVAVALAVVVVFGALLASAVFHALLAQGQQRLDRLNEHVSQAQGRYDDLRLMVDRLSAPERVVARAQQLGMISAKDIRPLTPAPGAASRLPLGAGTGGNDAPSGPGADSSTGYRRVKPYLGSGQ